MKLKVFKTEKIIDAARKFFYEHKESWKHANA